jgi:hypothetical protein
MLDIEVVGSCMWVRVRVMKTDKKELCKLQAQNITEVNDHRGD